MSPKVMEDCKVIFEEDALNVDDTRHDVLIMDNGWVRLGSDGKYTYHPPREIKQVTRWPEVEY